MSQVLNILDWYAMPSITGVIAFNRVVKPLLGLPIDEAAVAAAVPLAQTTIRALEALLGSQDYFAGPDVSLADLAAVAHLDMAPATPEGSPMLAGSPLLAWLDRINARPSVQATRLERAVGGRA